MRMNNTTCTSKSGYKSYSFVYIVTKYFGLILSLLTLLILKIQKIYIQTIDIQSSISTLDILCKNKK